MQDNFVKYQTFEVQPDLRQFVKYLWCIEAEPNDGDYFIFRTYATIYPTLFFALEGHVEPLGKQVKGNLLLVGQSNKWCRYKTSNDIKIFGITFYPFAMPLLFDIQADLITNQNFEFNSINQYKILSEFCQGVVDCKFNSRTVNNWLLERVLKGAINYPKVLSLISDIASGQADILNSCSERIFMSQRNFERKFKYYSGFTPKTFTNVIRVIRSFHAISFEQRKLLDTALEQSYFDQAHFSNEFKRHTGFQPKVFVKETKTDNMLWENFVDFFQFLSICPPVLCKNKINSIV